MRRFISENNFSKFVVGTLIATGITGYACFAFVVSRNPSVGKFNSNNPSDTNDSPSLSHDETLVRAMVQNAKESSWRENLSNAVYAQEHFVLPGRQKEVPPKFVEKIVQQSDKMMEDHKQQIEEKKKARQEFGKEQFSTWTKR